MTKFTIDDVVFLIDFRNKEDRDISSENQFVLVKTENMIAFYKGLQAKNPKNILEIGMFEGGSLVYFDKLYKPDTLVGIDLRKEPIEPLEKYRENHPHIKTYYGRYQEKEGTLMAARQNFPTGIDLVVDDASHLYMQTKRTFEMIFPLVCEGGLYIIEDWAWSHQQSYQSSKSSWTDQPALTNLVFELMLLCAKSGIIKDITVNQNLICITKGAGVLPENAFDFSNMLRGKEFYKL